LGAAVNEHQLKYQGEVSDLGRELLPLANPIPLCGSANFLYAVHRGIFFARRSSAGDHADRYGSTSAIV
jgi:hypothetical protein